MAGQGGAYKPVTLVRNVANAIAGSQNVSMGVVQQGGQPITMVSATHGGHNQATTILTPQHVQNSGAASSHATTILTPQQVQSSPAAAATGGITLIPQHPTLQLVTSAGPQSSQPQLLVSKFCFYILTSCYLSLWVQYFYPDSLHDITCISEDLLSEGHRFESIYWLTISSRSLQAFRPVFWIGMAHKKNPRFSGMGARWNIYFQFLISNN